MPKMSRLIESLFRLRYGNSSVVLGDVMEEYTMGGRSRTWVWRQLLSGYFPGAFSSFRNDVHYALRTMARNPGFAAIAVITIALGVGVNSGIFSLLNAVALRPLPVPDAGKIVSVYQKLHGKISRGVHGEASMFSVAEYEQYRDNNHVFTGVVAYAPMVRVTLGGASPTLIVGTYASCNYFDVLGGRIAMGRGLLASDCAGAGTGAVVVLSDELWRGTFGADPAIVGKSVILNRQVFTVAGVAAAGFHGTEVMYSAFWVPFTIQPVLEPADKRVYRNPNMSWLVMMGRLRDGVSMAKVRAELAVIAARIDSGVPGRTTTLSVDTATFAAMPEMRTMVTGVGAVILAAVGMVLLIVCANLANLLLARAAGRQKEIAVRLSVGATRGRLVRQLMTESLLIAMMGGVLGCIASYWCFAGLLHVVLAHLPKGIPDFALNLGPDVRVLGYSLAMTLLTGVAFGLVPALRATKLNPGGLSMDRAGGKLRGMLVGAQVAVCMILLIAAGLMLHALYAAQTIDPGFDTKNNIAVSFELRQQGYTEQQATAYYRDLTRSVAALPMVEGVALVQDFPLGDEHMGGQMKLAGSGHELGAEMNVVSGEYFGLLGIPIVRGRTFTAGETGVAIVSETTARRFWEGEDPIGKRMTDDNDGAYEVVGVVKDAQVAHLGRSNESYVYFPPTPKNGMRLQLLVRSKVQALKDVRAAALKVDPSLAIDVAPLEANLEWWRTPSRIVGILAGSLGGFALLLASMGIYGVTAFAVSKRVREIGIRMALGADAGSVEMLILRQSMRPVLIGAVVGIAGCAAVSRVLKSMLFGVSAYDLWSFVGVPVVLVAIALLASGMPARRAARLNPLDALRAE
jgi:predicted permease